MNCLLTLAQVHVPGYLKRRRLEELCAATAAAFGSDVPSLRGLSYEQGLRAYALYSSGQVERAAQHGRDLGGIRARLRENACQLGAELRTMLRVGTMGEALVAAQVLYRAIDIDFQGTTRGEICVSRCFFGDYYSGRVCEVMSAVDEGVLVGLWGDGRLEFTQRLTEGGDSCRARFVWKEVAL